MGLFKNKENVKVHWGGFGTTHRCLRISYDQHNYLMVSVVIENEEIQIPIEEAESMGFINFDALERYVTHKKQ